MPDGRAGSQGPVRKVRTPFGPQGSLKRSVANGDQAYRWGSNALEKFTRLPLIANLGKVPQRLYYPPSLLRELWGRKVKSSRRSARATAFTPWRHGCVENPLRCKSKFGSSLESRSNAGTREMAVSFPQGMTDKIRLTGISKDIKIPRLRRGFLIRWGRYEALRAIFYAHPPAP